MSTMIVQAIIAGRKTQTRRIITPQPADNGLHDHTRFPMAVNSDLQGWWGTVYETGEDRRFKPKCEPGDIIWVRENYQRAGWAGETLVSPAYMADGHTACGWKPSIHMPKDAARIWLRCTGVKVERAQDISEEDAIAEGICRKDYGRRCGHGEGNWQDAMHCKVLPYLHESHPQRAGWHWEDTKYSSECYESARHAFGALWQSIHNAPPKLGQPDGRWEANPWVWAYSFEVLSTTGKPKNI